MNRNYREVLQLILIASLLFTAMLLPLRTVNAAVGKPFLMKNLIELPSTDYDHKEADKMVDRLLKIEPEILEKLVYRSVKIRLINGKLTDEPEYKHLKRLSPRGWNAAYSYESLPGVGGNPVIARIGFSDRGNMHGSLNLELHETLHAIDSYVFDSISKSKEFMRIFNKEASFFNGSKYEELYSEEYFAETASMYYLKPTSKVLLKNRMPETYAFLDDLFTNYEAVAIDHMELEGHWAEKQMERLMSLRILKGFPGGSMRPNDHITREQFIKLLVESIAVPVVNPTSKSFDDQSDKSWSTPYIETAVKENIIVPDEHSGSFKPKQLLTRAEMAIWVARALDLEPDESMVTFADSDLITRERGLIGASIKSSLMNRKSGNQFDPNGPVSRAYASVVMSRLLDR